MLHIGGGEHLGALALGDGVLERAGGAELGLHFDAGRRLIGGDHLGQRKAQAAGGVEQDGICGAAGVVMVVIAASRSDAAKRGALPRRAYHTYAPGDVAFGKNSCWPPIL